jgi:hypothetical protein
MVVTLGVVVQSGRTGFSAIAPLPRLGGQGESREEALSHLQRTLSTWVECLKRTNQLGIVLTAKGVPMEGSDDEIELDLRVTDLPEAPDKRA